MIQPELVEHADPAYAPASGIEDDPSGMLTRRLEQLQDPIWMKHVLEMALEQLTRAPVRVDTYRIEYCKIKLDCDINMALQLRLRRCAGGATFSGHISCTSFLQCGRGGAGFTKNPASRFLNPSPVSWRPPGSSG